jgi:hypothetical protein
MSAAGRGILPIGSVGNVMEETYSITPFRVKEMPRLESPTQVKPSRVGEEKPKGFASLVASMARSTSGRALALLACHFLRGYSGAENI